MWGLIAVIGFFIAVTAGSWLLIRRKRQMEEEDEINDLIYLDFEGSGYEDDPEAQEVIRAAIASRRPVIGTRNEDGTMSIRVAGEE